MYTYREEFIDPNEVNKKVDIFFEIFEDIIQKQNVTIQSVVETEMKKINRELNYDYPVKDQLLPLVDEKIEKIKKEIQQTSNSQLVGLIKQKIRDAQPEMIDALYPIMGKLIQKYIKAEFEKLGERINQQLENTFSWQAIKKEFLFLMGIRERDFLIKKATEPILQEAFVIFQDSGLLLAHFSNQNTVDNGMIAGMLTAIKMFVQDAFQSAVGGDLDTIEYGSVQIILLGVQRFYLVAVVSGIVDSPYKRQMKEHLEKFNEKYLALQDIEILQSMDVNELLASHMNLFGQQKHPQKIYEYRSGRKQKSNFSWKFWSW